MQNQFFAQSFAEPLTLNNSQPREERPPKSPRRRSVRPAIFSAGHRRRIVRRSAHSSPLPRSGTLPNLNIAPGSAASSLVSSTAAAFVPTRSATSTPMKPPRSPPYATPPRRVPAPPEGRRKGPTFGRLFKSKELKSNELKSNELKSEEQSSPSELPDGALSPKACQVLGLPSANSESSSIAKSSFSSEDVYSHHVQIGRWSQGSPEPTDEGRTHDFTNETTLVSEPPMNRSWKESKMKALDWLGYEGPKQPKSAGLVPDAPSATSIDTASGNHSDSSTVPRTRAARSAAAKRRRNRKKRGKSIEKMSPITELSSASGRSDTGDGADAELDVISEYDKAFHLRRSMTAPLIPRVDLHGESANFPEEQGYEAEEEDVEHHEVLTYTRPFFRYDTELQRHTPTPASIARQFRELCLHTTPEELQEKERILTDTLRNSELESKKIAAEHLRLQREHAKFKAELLNIQKQSMVSHSRHEWISGMTSLDGHGCGSGHEEPGIPIANYDESDDESDDDGIGSDIDTDEESTVHFAQAVPVSALRITPEMNLIKLVDIPPRRVKPVDISPKLPPRNPRRFGHAVDIDFAEVKAFNDAHRVELNETTAFDGLEEVTALPGCNPVAPGVPAIRGGRVSRTTHPSNQNTPSYYSYPQSQAPSPYGHFRSSGFAYAKEKKAKLPKEESRNFVTGWLEDSSTAAQRPVSMLVDSLRLDPDVLADQNLDRAPVPPPKDATSARGAPRHFCVNNGHLFKPIDLKHAPDEVAVNQLQVQPYLRTPNGVKQHVRIPVKCERCGRDMNEQIWECGVSVCRLAVCFACAVDMQEEFETRAASSWDKQEAQKGSR